MWSGNGSSGVRSILALRRSRALVSGLWYRILVGVVGLGYACLAMIVSGMLYFPRNPLHGGWYFYIYPSGPGPRWSYPAILAGGPTVFLDLPLLSGVFMTLTAAGIGLGMSVAILLGVRLLRHRQPRGRPGPTAAGAAAGLTPTLFGLVTLGACCSTVAASTAGIALAGPSNGTTSSAALVNVWYLGLFQVVVVFVALIAQELILAVYGFLLQEPSPGAATPEIATRVRH